MEEKKRTPWRRWVLLVLFLIGCAMGGGFAWLGFAGIPPIQPEISIAPERLIETPLFTIPYLGDFYLVNTLPTLAVTFLLIVLLAYFSNRSMKQSLKTDLVPRGVTQDLGHPVNVIGGDPDAAGATVEVAELLARAAHSRRVDDRNEFLEVLGQQPVEERLVAVLKGCQPDVLLEVFALAPDVLELQAHLLVDTADPRR